MNWLSFALLTVCSWGVYGIFLHMGSMGMAGGDPNSGRIKAFLLVGVSYFLVAVLAPLIILMVKGASWSFPVKGSLWSLIAGIVGAMGALFVLLAFGAKGTPAAVMAIVFAGAPIVNSVVAISLSNLWGEVRWQFIAGILLAATGGCLVTFFKPNPHPPKKASTEKRLPGEAHVKYERPKYFVS
jgi:drug/metabolite transporter (DMT)-like permease